MGGKQQKKKHFKFLWFFEQITMYGYFTTLVFDHNKVWIPANISHINLSFMMHTKYRADEDMFILVGSVFKIL